MTSYYRSIEIEFHQDALHAEFPLSETPYICAMDVDQEYLTIYNPGKHELSLKGYFITDSKRLHSFTFPDNTMIGAHSELFLYTCPGANHHDTFREPNVLWENHDGSLRRKEVLNNDLCTMELHAPNGKCIGSCTGGHSGPSVVRRRQEELRSIPTFTFSPLIRTAMIQIRIFLLISMSIAIFLQSQIFLVLYWISFLLDILSRRNKQTRKDIENITSLAILGDRLNMFGLYYGALFSLFQFSTTDKLLYLIILASLIELTSISYVSEDKKINDCFELIKKKLSTILLTVIGLGSEIFLVLIYLIAIKPQGIQLFLQYHVAHMHTVIFSQIMILLSGFSLFVCLLAFVLRHINHLTRIYHFLQTKPEDDSISNASSSSS